MKKVLAATLLIGSLTATSAFAKEDGHEKEVKHYKHHEVKKVKTPSPVQTPTTPTQTPTVPTTTTLTNPIKGFAVTLGIPGGFNTNVKLVSFMWANLNNVYGYNVYVNQVKQNPANSSQAANNLYGVTVKDSLLFSNGAYQVILPIGTYTVDLTVVDNNGNESTKCTQQVIVK
jgi:hypothetical protein